MKIEVRLFGCFSEFEPDGLLQLQLPAGAESIGDARAAVGEHGLAHWPGFRPGLLGCSVFASTQSLLRDGAALPEDGRLCLLPPVSGG